MFELDKIIRENVKKLVPYSSARNEYEGKEGIFLDANENSFGSPLNKSYNRYPDPLQLELKKKISSLKEVLPENIFLGNGSDEAIDILFRAVCIPGKDNVIICPPTYGLYEVSAAINDVEVIKIPLLPEVFQLDEDRVISSMNENTKLIFICCPNNPTGNGVKWNAIKKILESFNGLVVIDEAYIDFANYRSLIPELLNYPNLVILQTFSKAWGMAGLRIGMAFAASEIISVFNRIKAPYNVNAVSQELILEALNNAAQVSEWIRQTVKAREQLSAELAKLAYVQKVYPSDANFLLLKMKDADRVYDYLIKKSIITRNRSKISLCEGCLRITIGTESENEIVLQTLRQYESKD